MCSARAYISSGQKEPKGKLTLYVEIPLLDIPLRVIARIHHRDRLHHLRQELLRSLRAERSPRGLRDPGGEGQRYSVDRVSSVHRPCICGRPAIDHVVQRIHAERYIIRYPEHSITAADHRFRIRAVSKTDPWRKGQLLNWKIVAVAGTLEKNVAEHRLRARGKILGQVVRCFRVKIRQSIESLRPRALQVISQTQIQS